MESLAPPGRHRGYSVAGAMCTDRCRWQVNGRLIELDGLKPGPIDHGVCTKDDWLGKSRTVIESRIA